MSRQARRRAAWHGLVAGFFLHTLAALWIWATWDPGIRASWLVWIDFPSALAYLGATGPRLLVASLLVGGLQWALLAALVTMLVGRLSVTRAADDAR